MDYILLDVRTQDEYCHGHLCGSWLVPTPLPPLSTAEMQRFKSILSSRLSGVQHSHPIMVYCKLGIRAGIARDILAEMGFTNVISLGGAKTTLKNIFAGEKHPVFQVCYCA